ncbi:DUF4168 domain-containing protein [Gloeothece verrucosa]|uniref:DUF4168 domain-containing protein n=1 Tax=Gloeothece verrucosa (strain PCC 7822) TaxID=497965 RepID=E0UGT6_GLOV7|nr:DUF4168 domain-containing protein [Gloeothece verrucosa]ADN14417.1 conserved hypothetical protein [Gloeothece verrucosa PCC 7822]
MLFKSQKKFQKKAVTTISVMIASCAFCWLNPAQAQTVVSQTHIAQASASNISNAELEQFVKVHAQLVAIDKQTTQQMIDVIQQEGMTIDRFNVIGNWIINSTDSKEAPTPPVSQAEMESFKKVVAKITPLQEQAEAKMKQVFATEKFEVERYKQIFEAVRTDPKLQNQVQQMLQK